MKKLICLLLLLTLATGVHAGDKKKKKPDASSAAAALPGGGGHSGGGSHGGGFSGVPGMGKSAGHTSAPRASTRSAPHMGSQGSTRAHNSNPLAPTAAKSTSNPLTHKGGQTGATSNSSNPLMRRGGQTGAKTTTSNPLTQKGGQANANSANNQGSNPLTSNDRANRPNGQAANPMTKPGGQPGGKNANPMAGKAATQPGMGGRNRGMVTNRNNPNMGRDHRAFTQTGRGFNNRGGARNWQHASHANYRVRNSREVFHNYRPIRHDRGWYTSRYDRVVVVGGGYYYWDGGYWYPAWGYDPAFSLYVYDGPIYSYDNLPPDQVTMNVQTALQDDGYYTGDVDGLVGPKTRDALGAYQTDHDLEITSAIDEPTVESLGLAQS